MPSGVGLLSNVMLSKVYRLPLKQSTTPLYSQRTPYFVVKVFSNTLSTPRFGFIVSKKVSGEAVVRNRSKRQLRALIEALLPRIAGGYDILFIVQKPAVEAAPGQLKAALLQFFMKKELLR